MTWRGRVRGCRGPGMARRGVWDVARRAAQPRSRRSRPAGAAPPRQGFAVGGRRGRAAGSGGRRRRLGGPVWGSMGRARAGASCGRVAQPRRRGGGGVEAAAVVREGAVTTEF